MLMQELYKVLSDDTWVTIIGNSILNPKYDGILKDIPVSLLDSQIISIIPADLKQLAITIV